MNTRLSGMTRDAWIAVAVAFVVGLFLGWLVLGYLVLPAQYTNADPSDLKAAWKEQYVAMVADSFAVNHDVNAARDRLRWFTADEQTKYIKDMIAQRNSQGQGADAARLATFAVSVGLTLATATTSATPTPAPSGGSLLGALGPILLLLLLVIVIAALGLLFYSRFKAQGTLPSFGASRRPEPAFEDVTPMPASTARPMTTAAVEPPISVPPRTAPISMPSPQPSTRGAPSPRPTATAKNLGTFAATYKFGDDNYDTAFTLETPRNEFLGECGMGISETIGEGKPDKVTAFDLWLFDKTDVRTVTQILMTEHAFNDQALRSKLAQKGELTLAEKGKHIPLQTATLRVDATIVDLVYASTPGLPANSHFQKLIVEMVAAQK